MKKFRDIYEYGGPPISRKKYLEDGTLVTDTGNALDTVFAALKKELTKDMDRGNYKRVNNIAKQVQMSLEKGKGTHRTIVKRK